MPRRKEQSALRIREFVVTLALASAFAVLEYLCVFESFEIKTLDMRFRFRGPVASDTNIVMVDVADDAVEQFGQFPFPRQFHGLFIDAARSMGAAQIIFDIYFIRPTDEESDEFLAAMAAEAGNAYFPLQFFPHNVGDGGGRTLRPTGSLPLSRFARRPIPARNECLWAVACSTRPSRSSLMPPKAWVSSTRSTMRTA